MPFAILRIAPGLLLTAAIAAAAYALRAIPGVGTFSPMILAILLGIALHNTLGTPSRAQPGVAFTLRRILRLAIILLGLQLTAQQVAAVGPPGRMPGTKPPCFLTLSATSPLSKVIDT